MEARSPKLVGAPASIGRPAPEALRLSPVSQGDYPDGHLQRGRESGSEVIVSFVLFIERSDILPMAH